MRRSRLLIALAGLLMVATVTPSTAQSDVDVAVSNPGGSRTLYVEDLLGNPLTSLDFGVTRLQPFRVRVVDATMDRTGFTVSAEMTKLYRDTGAGLDYATAIPSSNVEIAHPLVALNVLDVSARVQPVFDLAATLTGALCTAVTTLGGSCAVSVPDVAGVVQTLPLTVDLSALQNLPLLPQGSDPGAFTNPSFAGVGAADPAPSGTTATARQMIRGLVVADTSVLAALQTALGTAVSGKTASELINSGLLTSSVRDAVGGTVWDSLSLDDQTALLAALAATAENVVANMVLGQTGTYLSFPVLTVNVPSDAAKGTYRGTLVVTGLQS
ncbi:MAG: hypothetical protein ACR2H3_12915 [Acidimicrobiales bacterium]